MRVVHITDPHFDHLSERYVAEFAKRVASDCRSYGAPQVVITGDIASASSLDRLLSLFCQALGDVPVGFALGNHDIWGSSFAWVRRTAAGIECARYLPDGGPLLLDDRTALVGVDGWYDMRAGSGAKSRVLMNDWYRIDDFRPLSHAKRIEACRALADASAVDAVSALDEAVRLGVSRIVLATHVPPFTAASWHEGAMGDREHLPLYTNLALGEAVLGWVARHDVEVTVLCGHTHTARDVKIAPGLRCVAGRAEYGEAYASVVEV